MRDGSEVRKAVAVHFEQVVDVPVMQVLLAQFIDASPYGGSGGGKWFFAVKCCIFRAPPGRLELSAIFSEPSMVKRFSPSRAPAQFLLSVCRHRHCA